MPTLTRVTVRELHPAADPNLARDLVALQRASYAVEAALIGSDAIPGLTETAQALVAADLTWLGVRDATGLLGAAALAETAELVDLERLVVAPRAFRRGVGRALVGAVLERAAARRVLVCTGRDNLPARTLYASAGFREAGELEVEPGLWVVRLVHVPDGEATSSTSNPSEFSR